MGRTPRGSVQHSKTGFGILTSIRQYSGQLHHWVLRAAEAWRDLEIGQQSFAIILVGYIKVCTQGHSISFWWKNGLSCFTNVCRFGWTMLSPVGPSGSYSSYPVIWKISCWRPTINVASFFWLAFIAVDSLLSCSVVVSVVVLVVVFVLVVLIVILVVFISVLGDLIALSGVAIVFGVLVVVLDVIFSRYWRHRRATRCHCNIVVIDLCFMLSLLTVL